MFKASRLEKPERYNEDIFIRNLSHLEKIDRESEFDFLDTFRKESALAQK